MPVAKSRRALTSASITELSPTPLSQLRDHRQVTGPLQAPLLHPYNKGALLERNLAICSESLG